MVLVCVVVYKACISMSAPALACIKKSRTYIAMPPPGQSILCSGVILLICKGVITLAD